MLAATLALVACTYPSGKHITVVFRYDDLSEISDTILETKLISAFHRNDMAFTVGVVPFVFNGNQEDPTLNQNKAKNLPLGLAKIDMLRSAIQEGVVEVAMHGYSHQTIPYKGGHKEFDGLDYALQYKKISDGVVFLKDRLKVSITTFIPPWNRYDTNTLKVLNESGFSVLSADQDGSPMGSSPLLFLPSSCDLANLKKTVIGARSNIDTHPMIVVLFHQYDILGNEANRPQIDLAGFNSLLAWLKVQNDIKVLTIQQAVAQYPDLNAQRYEFNRAIRDSQMIPPMLKGLIDPQIYQSPFPLMAVVSLFYLGVLLISGLIIFLIGKLIFAKSNTLMWVVRIAVILLLIFVVKYAFRGTKVGFRGAISVAILIGATIGIWWSSLRKTKKAKKHQGELE